MELPSRSVRPVETAVDGDNYLVLLPAANAVRRLEPDLTAIALLTDRGPGDRGR